MSTSSEYVELLTSTLFDAPVYKTYGGLMAREEFEPAGFAASLGLKDVRLVLAAAESLQVPLPMASLIRDRFLTLLANGGAHLDWSALGKVASWEAGSRESGLTQHLPKWPAIKTMTIASRKRQVRSRQRSHSSVTTLVSVLMRVWLCRRSSSIARA